jgi:hypothetical protein
MAATLRPFASFIATLVVACVGLLVVGQCVSGCALIEGVREGDEDKIRTELALLAGDADGIALALEADDPDLAADLRLFGEICRTLSESDPLDASAALVALAPLLDRVSESDNAKFKAYVVAADMLLRRLG